MPSAWSRLRSFGARLRQRCSVLASRVFARSGAGRAVPLLASRYAGLPPEERAARELVDAVDAGGVPLNTARINQVARGLGLEVARSAPPEQTLERLRCAVARMETRGTRS